MNHAPKKAILLAAGFGSRMQPLSHEIPKPLMPLWDKPLIEHSIELLISWGVRDILINLHHNPDPILQFVLKRNFKSCRIQFSFESEILGTGGALKKAAWFIEKQPIWMLNTDIAAELDPAPLLKAFHKEKAIAALWMHPTLGPRTVEIADDRITNFSSSAPASKGTYTFCGLQLLSPHILKYLPKAKFSSVIEGYRYAIKDGETVLGITCSNSFWADLGTRERYLNAHRDILAARRKGTAGKSLLPTAQLKKIKSRIPANTKTAGFAVIGTDVSIGKDITIKDSVIWDNTVLNDNCYVTDSIIGGNISMHGQIESSSAVKCSVIPTSDTILSAALKTMRSKAENATLIALPARGSNRSFERIITNNKSAILIRYDDTVRPENARYTTHTELLLNHGITIPKLLLDLPQQKAALFEDAGTTDLQQIAAEATSDKILKYYKKTIRQLVKLHSISKKELATVELEPPFTKELYAWETNLFTEYFLQGYLQLPKSIIAKIIKELSILPEKLLKAPQVLLHRDMQSSNVLLKNGKTYIIDFQGMRMGAAYYDVASLLCDPYVMLKKTQQEILLQYYQRQTQCIPNKELYTAAAIQRLTQALGAFGRLSQLPDMQHFEKHIPNACRMLTRILKNTTDFTELKAAM